jgi:putative FmdB family regulatory protein
MPIYEYACRRCGDFEVTQRISEEPLKQCPTCGAKVTKLISRSAFHLKGSGWYMTDYGKNGSSKSTSDDTKGTTSETKESSPASTSSSQSTAAKESSAKESSSTT